MVCVESVFKEVAMAENFHIAGNKLFVDVIIEKKQIQFQVDTGTDVSLMNERSLG